MVRGAALGLLAGIKAAWHIGTFLVFITMVTRLVAIACAPGEIADGDKYLFEAAVDIGVLAIAMTIYAYLRKPSVRQLYAVPVSYRADGGSE